MNMKNKISVIVPVYNRKELLAACVKSLLEQTYRDFELCIVDDGSTDGTEILCDELQKEDSRIRVLHVKNGGAAYARRRGWNKLLGSGYSLLTLMIRCRQMLCGVCFKLLLKIQI